MKPSFTDALASLKARWLTIPTSARQMVMLASLGIFTGLVAVAFHIVSEWIAHHTYHALAEYGTAWFIGGTLASVVIGSLLATWIVRRFAPQAGGGGVLPTKLAFWKDFGEMPASTAIAKFAGSALTMGSGVSLGPEGPAVQIGAATLSSTAGFFGVAKQRRRIFSAAGSAAALAAVFNAPLTAITFVLEEIVGDLNSRLLGGILLAAVMGALVSHALIGNQPAFQVAALSEPGWRGVLLCPLVALVAAGAGIAFHKGALAARLRFRGANWLPAWAQPATGALGTWVLGGAAFLYTGHLGVFGIGYADITACIDGRMTWSIALVLGIAKLGATILAVGAGGCGGIFAPNLFLGAMCGGAIAAGASRFMPLTHSDQAMLVMSGMCACLGAVIRTPITCILLIFEVTHQFVIVPLLLLATLVSQLVARRLAKEGLYEEMLRQNGEDPHHVLPPRDYKRWRELPAGTITCFKPVVIESLDQDRLKALIDSDSHERFPVRNADGSIAGILTRQEAADSLAQGREPRLAKALWVSPHDSVSKAQKLLVESSVNFICVGDYRQNALAGVITLHDLLRGQQGLGEDEDVI
ncbi:chloride channel protein [Rariglobus hedericola]|uniref:Chloride channel protein n=1 Tax=Rariglobus hedericola TaxID=2597822 RepID=A0A556QL59_9BACT|nr:chloride channel protein [Rariglobus hedericola]TSJ77383.1 chloride channel protein [Rariglobus hedericola]